MDRYVGIEDIKNTLIDLNGKVFLEKKTAKPIMEAIVALPQVSFETLGNTTFVKYEDLLESSWPWCAGYGHCDNCSYGEDDYKCGIYEWMKSLPKYQMGMEKVN